MIVKVLIPNVGMGTDEGTISRWLKREGDRVTEGETLVELEFAKAMQDVPAPATGILIRILLHEGHTAPVHTEIALIEAGA